MQGFDIAKNCGLGVWLQVVEGLHRRLSDFIHEVVVHRREEAIGVWRELVEGGSPCSSLQVAQA